MSTTLEFGALKTMYNASLKSKERKPKGKTGTRQSPSHPLHGTPRILILASKHPEKSESESDNEQSD